MATSTAPIAEATKTGRGGKLSSRPLMVYPLTPEDRQAIVDAAIEATPSGMKPSTSSFIMKTMLEAIAKKKTK
jgi:hypothetical protein